MRFCKTFNLKKQIIPFIVCLALPLIVGAVAGIATKNEVGIYNSLVLPPLSPPSYIFSLVWTVLYILMGISSYIILKSKSWLKPKALYLYFAQLIFNFVWPFLFFNKEMYFISFIWLMILWLLVLFMITMFWQVDKKASVLQIPYLLWLTFAAYLNLGIFILNH